MFINYYFIFGRALAALMLGALCFPVYAQVQEERVEFKFDALPSPSELLDAKLKALSKSLVELDALIVLAEKDLAKEQGLEEKFLDNHAYLSLSIKNTAPGNLYRLESTRVYFDNAKKPLARGGVHNQGLPRKSELFFGAIKPGCHEITVIANYERLTKKGEKFVVDRLEKIEKVQAFMATSGYRIEIEIEGYEAHNTFVNLYRGPEIRFNKSARPNFVSGAPLISLDDVLKQGRLHINYITEDNSNHRLASKSVSIDGLPILSGQKQDDNDASLIFAAPLAPGKHRLNTTLVFAEKKWVTGGPSYNFKLNFEQEFYVIAGQTTMIELLGMPKGGIKSSLSDTRYARSTTKILSKEYSEFFLEGRCPKNVSEPVKAVEEKAEPKAVEPEPAEETIEQKAEEPKVEKALEEPQEEKIEQPAPEKAPEGNKPRTGE